MENNEAKGAIDESHPPELVQQVPTTPVVTFADAFSADPPSIVTPLEIASARNLCPDKLGPRILQISQSKVLKFGVDVHLGEANAVHLLAQEAPDVPVPHVCNAYKIGDVSYILMEYIPGPTLGKCWNTLSALEREAVASQIRQHVASLRQIRGQFYGAVGRGPCEDSIFKHAYTLPQLPYGPYESRQDFNKGVLHALRNSRPNPSQYNRALEAKILQLRGDEVVFTHGDLGRGNIVFHEGKVTILDWGAAGFSVEEREFVEAKWQASMDEEWEECISSCIPDYTPHFTFWDHLVNEMRLFSGV